MDEVIEADLRRARGAVEELATRRTELRRRCEGAVIEWRWAREGSGLQCPVPLYRQRYGQPSPRLLDEEPAVPEDEEQHGFDAAGDIVVTREYVGPGSFREELRVRCGDIVTGYRWAEGGEPLEINVARFAGGKIRSYVTVWAEGLDDALQGWSAESYEYDGDLVSEIQELSDTTFRDERFETATRIRASYDPRGKLLDLREHGDSGEKVLFRARGTGPSMTTLQRRVEDRLVETLPELVRARAGAEPIYCLGLHYQLEWPLPPRVALGLERDRQAWVSDIDDAETLRRMVWNPAEFSTYRNGTVSWELADIDPELARAIRAIPESADAAAEHAEVTLNRAARRLQRLDWHSIASVTDDFVVFAVDLELIHLEENFRYSVPAVLRRRLYSRGLI